MSAAAAEYPRETLLERIEGIPLLGDMVRYVVRHPISTFFTVTAGLAAASHAGLLQRPGFNVLGTPGQWSKDMYGFLGQGASKVAGNLGAPEWLSSGAQRFLVDSWRGVLAP
jgi:hypothetical protein